jgi:RNA polymerase sigma-70 factor, ECF subfamily
MGFEIRERRVEQLHRSEAKSAEIPNNYVKIIVGDKCSKSGSRQHIIELYDQLRPLLQAYLSSKGLRKEHSEDVIQEAFLRLVRHILERGADENTQAWLFRVAHNLSMDHHRFERRRLRDREDKVHPANWERIDPAPDPEQKLILGERMRRFRETFAQLTPKQRHCLLLRAKGLRYREIALVMGISVQRVGELMQRVTALVED